MVDGMAAMAVLPSSISTVEGPIRDVETTRTVGDVMFGLAASLTSGPVNTPVNTPMFGTRVGTSIVSALKICSTTLNSFVVEASRGGGEASVLPAPEAAKAAEVGTEAASPGMLLTAELMTVPMRTMMPMFYDLYLRYRTS